MSKRLILVLALVMLACFTCAAYAEVQNVKVSGDITAYGIIRDFSLKSSDSEAAWASIARVRVDADLTDNVIATVRLLNERYWGNETNNAGASSVNTNIDLDLAYVTLKEFLYSPLTLTVGRQELHFGNDMIVGDPDTNNNVSTASAFGGNNLDKDLTARKAFDAIRATLNYDPLVIDLIASEVRHTTLTLDDNVRLYGVNLNYKPADMKHAKNTIVEGYWFQKNSGKANYNLSQNKSDIVNVVGGRIATSPMENMRYSLEAAYQFGRYAAFNTADTGRPDAPRKAWALETALSYNFAKVKYTPAVTGLYAYFSGDHENQYNATTGYNTRNGTYRGWDPMFENQKFGDIANALFNQTNAHIVGGILTAKPMDDITLKGEYYAFWWAKKYPAGDLIVADARDTGANLLMTGRKFAGQEIDITATYDYTEDVQFALMGGVLYPGASFAKGNSDAASELIGSMKVTF